MERELATDEARALIYGDDPSDWPADDAEDPQPNDERVGHPRMNEIEIRADEVKPGDYLVGLGRVQSCTSHQRITLSSEGNDWRVNLDKRHRVVVLRRKLIATQNG